MNSKYVTMLTTLFVTFTYGFELPILFLASSVCFLFQFCLDKLLVVYWFEMIPVKSDSMINLSLKIVQFAPSMMLIAAARSLQLNLCMIENEY
jgi:hypothetical protein